MFKKYVLPAVVVIAGVFAGAYLWHTGKMTFSHAEAFSLKPSITVNTK